MTVVQPAPTVPTVPPAPTVRPAPAETSPPVLRLLPAPATEPPYDDDLPRGAVSRRTAPVRLAAVPAPLRLVPPLPGEEDEAQQRARTALDQLPPPRPFTHALVQRLLEVVAGVRPLPQLRRDTTPELYARLEQDVATSPRSAGPRPDGRAVRSVHLQTRPEGIAEACATVVRHTPRGPRVVAVALRLEGLDGRWRCTELLGL